MTGEQSTDGIERTWDHDDCPCDDCDGELQQQDQYNVMCLSCERVWTHVNNQTKHYLQTADFETVAEKPVVMTDGGQVEDGTERTYTCVRCRETFETEEEVINHLKTEHEGESDGKYDYSVNITGEFP